MQATSSGLLLVALADILALPFEHLVSGLDEDAGTEHDRCGSTTTISGYTEWVAGGFHRLTVGWDWKIDARGFVRIGVPRSNIRLLDRALHPYEQSKSDAVLATVVDTIPWQEQARRALQHRYSVA